MLIKLLKKMRSQKGFTLIELIFVVVILAILAGVALINLGGADDDAKSAAIKTDFRTLATAIKVYKTKTNAFPDTLDVLTSDSGKYHAMIDSVPKDPSASIATQTYTYTSSSSSVTIGASDGQSMVVK
jgi:general secretion pathway protein G